MEKQSKFGVFYLTNGSLIVCNIVKEFDDMFVIDNVLELVPVKMKSKLQTPQGEKESIGFITVPFPKASALLFNQSNLLKQNICAYKILTQEEMNKIFQTINKSENEAKN